MTISSKLTFSCPDEDWSSGMATGVLPASNQCRYAVCSLIECKQLRRYSQAFNVTMQMERSSILEIGIDHSTDYVYAKGWTNIIKFRSRSLSACVQDRLHDAWGSLTIPVRV